MGLFGSKIAGPTPQYETKYMGFWIKVYPNRVEFKNNAGTKEIPINQVASIEIGMMGYMQIIIETTGGTRYKIPCTKKKEVKNAIYQAQEAFNNMQGNTSDRGSVADELTKLNQLKEQGILSNDEFNEQKKKILS